MAQIRVDTKDLENYVSRIQNVITRVGNLNYRIYLLYLTGKVEYISSFVRYNRFSDGIGTLNACIQYIDYTVSDINKIEEYFGSVEPLNFVKPSRSLISPANKSDIKHNSDINLGVNILGAADSKTSLSDYVKSIVEQIQNLTDSDGILKSIIDQLSLTLPGAGTIYEIINALVSSKAFLSNNVKSVDGITETILKHLSKGFKIADKTSDIDEFGLTSSVLGYLSQMCGLQSSVSLKECFSNALSSFKSSVDLEVGSYDYLLKTLSGNDATRFASTYGNLMFGASIFSEILGLGKTGFDAYSTFKDPNSSTWNKGAASADFAGGVYDVGLGIYIANQLKNKTIQYTTSSGKVVNQILATDQKLVTSKVSAKNAKAAGKYLILGDTIFSTISGTLNRIGEVTKDGEFIWYDDGASVGIYGSVSGLDALVKGVTWGIIDVDAEAVAADLESDMKNYYRRDNPLANHIRNKDNPWITRAAASGAAAVHIVGENVVELAVDGVQTIGSWISSGWDAITNIF